jgi:thiosulfate/3-mercaptopyruvate sulfurtransferase
MGHSILVDADELHAHLHDPHWLIFDCRHSLADFSLGRRLYDQAHLPGAFYADLEHDLAGEKGPRTGRHPLPSPEAFAAFLRRHGANDATQIIAYDAGGDMFAARLWFLCRWIGHDDVAVLDGGLAAWHTAKYPTTAEVPVAPEPGNLTVAVRDELVVDATYLGAHLGTNDLRVIDARAADRFGGRNETVDPVAGHIPGALNRPFKENFSNDARLRPAGELRAAFTAFGPPASLVHQCGSGVSAAVNLLAMEAAGLPGSRLYAGGWSEWITDPSRPIVTAASAAAPARQ